MRSSGCLELALLISLSCRETGHCPEDQNSSNSVPGQSNTSKGGGMPKNGTWLGVQTMGQRGVKSGFLAFPEIMVWC